MGVGREQRQGHRAGCDSSTCQGAHRGVGLDGDDRRHGWREVGQVVAGSETQDQQPTARLGQHRPAQPTKAATFPCRRDESVDLREHRMGVLTLTAHTCSIGPVRLGDRMTRILRSPARRRCGQPFVEFMGKSVTPTLACWSDQRQMREYQQVVATGGSVSERRWRKMERC